MSTAQLLGPPFHCIASWPLSTRSCTHHRPSSVRARDRVGKRDMAAGGREGELCPAVRPLYRFRRPRSSGTSSSLQLPPQAFLFGASPGGDLFETDLRVFPTNLVLFCSARCRPFPCCKSCAGCCANNKQHLRPAPGISSLWHCPRNAVGAASWIISRCPLLLFQSYYCAYLSLVQAKSRCCAVQR